jgi:hypothetical protein
MVTHGLSIRLASPGPPSTSSSPGKKTFWEEKRQVGVNSQGKG